MAVDLSQSVSTGADCVAQLATTMASHSADHAQVLLVLDGVDDLQLLEREDAGAVSRLLSLLTDRLRGDDQHAFSVLLGAVHLPKLLRGVVSRTVDVPVVDSVGRAAFLAQSASKHSGSLAWDAATLDWLSASTHGFTLAHLVSLVRLSLTLASELGGEGAARVAVAAAADALSTSWGPSAVSLRPSALPTPQHAGASDDWGDLRGYTPLKLRLSQLVLWPMLHPDRLAALGVRGPPLCCTASLLLRLCV